MAASPSNDSVKEILKEMQEKRITKLRAFFSKGKGVVYDRLAHDFDEIEKALDHLKQKRIVTSEVSDALLKCPHCDSYKFSLSFVCGMCSSTNVARRPVIEHLPCGNIDFEENFQLNNEQGSILLCNKCHKRLNAIGVDYSKPGYFFRCNSCNATLPNVENRYGCFGCGKPSGLDELEQLPLYTHLVNLDKLSDFLLDHDSFLSPLVETLSKIGIKSALPGEVVGESKLKHAFHLVTYDNHDYPSLVADVIVNEEQELTSSAQKWTDDVVAVMAFYARCIDVSNLLTSRSPKSKLTKVLIAIPKLSQNASKLAATYGITVIESASKAETIPKIVELIARLSNKTTAEPTPHVEV